MTSINVFADQDSYVGDTTIYGGSSVSLKPNVLIIFDSSGSMGGNVSVEVCQADSDSDGIIDESDNCPNTSNASQEDTDSDQIGDACDDDTTLPDTDGDGKTDDIDNCIVTVNPLQEDSNLDGVGDACEALTGDYNPDVNYTNLTTANYCEDNGNSEACRQNRIYRCTDDEWNDNGLCAEWSEVHNLDLDELRTSDLDCNDPRSDLTSEGKYTGTTRIRDNGRCAVRSRSYLYALGNWIDWYNSIYEDDSTVDTGSTQVCTTISESKNQIARNVVTDLIETTDGVNFGVMRFYDYDDGGTFITRNVDGSNYTSDIKDMDEIHTGTTTNREALVEIVDNIPAQDWTPLGESLYESMRYFTGDNSAFRSTNYTSPIEASCQPNYVIVITDGMATRDSSSVLSTLCTDGDCDGDNNSGDGVDDSLDDVAWYLYNTDLSSDYTGVQNVKTYTIGFGLDGADADAVQLLQDAADNGQGAAEGEGKAYLAESYQTLTSAFSSIIGEVLDTNSAFVAPVVPTSPENKVYSGERIYLGFFKPQTSGNWLGNLKKFGIDEDGDVLDVNGDVATDANGTFLSDSVSYWGTATDGGNVDEGGVGDILSDRNLSTSPRNIYTYTGTSTNLIDTANAFTASNSELTVTNFSVSTIDQKNEIINYVHGYDSYDEDIDSVTSEQRDWILGDILHSEPAIQVYNTYDVTNESNTSMNQTIIYVGSNDGQLHAFRDADGSELWSFIPPSFLPDLQNLGTNDIHEYFMDGNPTLYVYDYDGDGNIGTGPETGDTDPTSVTDNGANDKVILIVNMRRGGGINTPNPTETRGSYFALDVTNPTTPIFLWELNSESVDGSGDLIYGELGETWAAPTFGKVRYANASRLVAFISAGYDNNEDLRFGDTQRFPNTTSSLTSTILATADAGDITSTGDADQVNPRGRGIYLLELGQFSTTGALTLYSQPQKLWEYVYDSDTSVHSASHNPTFSFVSEVAPIDTDFDGYIDRLYAGDTGGNMWRFDISSKTYMSQWDGTKVFSANPNSTINSGEATTTNGRKVFYRPSVVQEADYIGVYFGSGDRAHPLNQAVIDRLYAFYDRDTSTTQSEANLVNVTEDNLQVANPVSDPSDLSTCTLQNTSVGCTLKNLYNDDYYGWFINLDQKDGEKVLANALVFNGVAYYTTFTPNMDTDDPCLSGDLGVGTLYAVDYKTGEAVFNFDKTNDVSTDDNYASDENERSKGSGDGEILRRSDRSLTIGSGIPSGAVITVNKDGSSNAFVGCGGGLCGGETDDGGTTVPLYWIME